jgi:Divergent InlB B-repeat domain
MTGHLSEADPMRSHYAASTNPRSARIILSLILSLAVVPSLANAQVDVTATGGVTNASYTTLKSAFDAINAGTHSADITIDLSGNTSEAASAILNGSGSGSASYSSILIRPTGGASRSVSGNLTAPLVDLNGADNVTIDGLNTGGNALALSNSNTGAAAQTIRFINDATQNVIQNCTINGSSAATTSGTILFGTTTGSTGNDNNLVTGCNIGPVGAALPYNAVYAAGTTTTTALNNSGVVISNNSIHDFFGAGASSNGILVAAGNTDWTISGNSLYQSAARTATVGNTHAGISIASGNNHVVTGNFIGGSTANAGGTAWSVSGAFANRFIGISLAVGTVTPTSVQNNTIRNFVWSSTSGATILPGVWIGIYASAGAVNVGTVTGNMIGDATGTGSISATISTTGGISFGIGSTSTGAVAIANNTIGSMTLLGSTTAVSHSFAGIQTTAGNNTVSGNVVGSTATANSINASTASTNATGQAVTGISASTATITGNTIANLNNAYAGTTITGQIRGIVTTTGVNNITGNTIRSLSTASLNAGTGTSAAAMGIAQTSVSQPQTISQNVVYSLSSSAASAAVSVVGIANAGPSSGTNLVTRNVVHSLSLSTSSATASVTGIIAVSGAASFQNNMVRLGVDAAGAPLTTGSVITGIAKASTITTSFYFNSVWIGGTGVGGTANTYAFRRTTTATADDVRDNIFVNLRQNGAGTGKHFAYVRNATTTVTSDYNIYDVGSPSTNLFSLDGGTTSIASLQALRAGDLQDASSGVGNPRFAAPADPVGSLSLKLQDPSPAEGSGVLIASVTEDQEGDLRNANTPTDIGADAGLYSMTAATDIFTPLIAYTALPNTNSTADRTLTVTITDVAPAGGGVPTTGPLVPRIWYKKSTDGTWTLSEPGTLTSGTGTNGTWDFTILASSLSPAQGDVIQYYVVAQDQASTPNLWYQPAADASPIHSDVNTQLTAPAAPQSYSIWIPFAGSYYVPNDPGGQAARTYPTLTGPGGLFAAINATSVSGNFTVVINGDVSTETGANALNSWLEEGAGGYTMTINPDGTTLRTLTGTPATAGLAMIKFSGASRVTIDGMALYLRFRNSAAVANAGAAIQFDNGAANDALMNCIVESSESNTTRGAIVLGGIASATVHDITISGNDLRNATAAPTGAPANLITGNSANISVITISNNNMHNFTFSAVNLGGWSNSSNVVGSAITISGNNLYDDAAIANASGFCAIGIGGAGDGHLVSGNFIGGKAPACGGAAWPFATSLGSNYIWGISVQASGAVIGSSIQGNTIQNMTFSSNYFGLLAINTANGKFAIGTVTGNTIGHPTTASSITFARGAVQSPAVIGINAASSSSVDIRNNVIANLTGNSSVSSDPYIRAISLSPAIGTSGSWFVENNTLQNLSFPGNSGSGANSMGIAVTAATGPPVTYDIGGIAGNTLNGLTFGTSSATNFGIYVITSAATSQIVSNNTISGVTGVGPFYGIVVSAPFNAAQSFIQNNIVQGVTLNTPGGEFRGISLTGNPGASGVGAASATGNLVGSDATSNSISNSGAAATTGIWVEGYNNPAAGLIDLSNSTVANMTASGTGTAVAVRGIYSGLSGGYVGMSDVSVHDLSTTSSNVGDGATAPAVAGIWLLGTRTPSIENSTIHALRAATTGNFAVAVDGIYINGGTALVQRNHVYDLTNTAGNSAALIRGIYQFGATSSTIANNEIAITNGSNTNPVQMLGIAQNLTASSGVGNVYYNSVYVGGSEASGGTNSYAFVRQANFADVLTDNLLFNDRTNTGSATGSHYAVGASATGAWVSDYNALIASDAAKLGLWSGADQTFAAWQATSGGDAASLGETTANVTAVQLFTDPANGGLDIRPTSGYDVPPIVSNAGTPVGGITTDIGGLDVRNTANPDIGADEIDVDRTMTAPGNWQPASPAYAGHFDDVLVSGAGEPSLTGDVHVFGVLSLEADNVTTGSHVLTVRPGGSVARTSGHVVGNLRKYVDVGGPIDRTFEVGTGSDFTPFDLQFSSVNTPGYVQGTTVATDHPSLGSSLLDPARSANRYWTIDNEGVAFSTVDATFHFVPGDVDAGADPSQFVVGKFDSPDWSLPAIGVQTPTSTEATGLASFSEFVVGQLTTHTLTYTPGPGGTISGSTLQIVNDGADGTPVTAVPNVGYHFVDWSDAVTTATRTETNVTADISVTANFVADGSTINVGSPPGPITLVNPTRTVPVTIDRVVLTPMLAFSVKFAVSPPLNVQGGLSGIHEGTYLSAVNPTTSFNLIDLGTDGGGNHIYSADGTTLGPPCGASAASGTLFTIDLSSAAANGSGTVTVTSVKLRDCSNADLPWGIGTASTISIDQSAPNIHVIAPDGGETWHVGSSQSITWTGSDPEGVTSYDLEFSTDGGTSYPNAIASVPGTETSYAWTIPAMPGTAVSVRITGHDVNGNADADESDANFAIAFYTLTYAAGANGSLSGTTPQSVSYGGDGTPVTAVADAGHHFVDWSDGVLTATRTETNVTADVTVTASFVVNPAVAPVANLHATQIRPGTFGEQTTPIQLTWDATPLGTTVEVWRKGFGSYPEYDDAGGVTPTASITYPPGAGWVKVEGLTSSGSNDLPAARDFYFYVAYAQDGFGTWSPTSTMTSGTLDYHLGDVSDGVVVGTGNNKVYNEDISLLGTYYGATDAAVTPVNYLDVGPTSTMYVDGLPATDNKINFEDLVIFALNHGLGVTVPAPVPALAVTGAVSADEVVLEAPTRTTLDQPLTARITMRGTGAIIALSTQLTWDPAVVEPVKHTIGDWLAQQNGQVFSAKPGSVDAAVMGTQGVSGEGVLAVVEFRVLSAGDPKLGIESVDARDFRNHKVGVTESVRPQLTAPPFRTQLSFARPNPFRQTVSIPFSLAVGGPVELTLYSVDGRRVRELVNGIREPGDYDVVWDGRDDKGSAAMAGVYYARLVTPQGRFTRTVTRLK